jgi:hypothetical protein
MKWLAVACLLGCVLLSAALPCAAQPRLKNVNKVVDRSVTTTLDAVVREIAGQAIDPTWIAWETPSGRAAAIATIGAGAKGPWSPPTVSSRQTRSSYFCVPRISDSSACACSTTGARSTRATEW